MAKTLSQASRGAPLARLVSIAGHPAVLMPIAAPALAVAAVAVGWSRLA